MIAICNHCHTTITPAPPVIGQPNHELMRLAEAMQCHLSQQHKAEAQATFQAAMNAQALFLLSQFRCSDPEFYRVCSESLKQIENMMREFRAALEPVPPEEPKA